MSRLDDVLARHAERKKMTPHKTAIRVVILVVAAVVVLELFTNLGTPTVPAPPPAAPRAKAERVDDVPLMTPHAPAKR